MSQNQPRKDNALGILHLTQAHVDFVHKDVPDPGPQLLEGFRPATDDDHVAIITEIKRSRPQGAFWLYGYGSLIWKPETTFTEQRLATARGWHRAFCLGWDYRYRGCHAAPGLMMALDRGGQCKGMIYKLPEETLDDELRLLLRREAGIVPSAFPWRWIKVRTDAGDILALTFAMNRASPRYISGLSEDELVEMFATAHGHRGTMAEYLRSTVAALEQMNIRDRNLWRLQQRVASRIDFLRAEQTHQ